MYKMYVLVLSMALMSACGGGSGDAAGGSTTAKAKKVENDGKGIGEIKNVTLNDPLKPDMVDKGRAIYDMKCAACHKLTDQRVVGPGWKGVTTRRKPEWIMNMTTNVEIMIDNDPAAQALFKECLVRMPNQNLTIDDARDILEFMYSNDGGTVGG